MRMMFEVGMIMFVLYLGSSNTGYNERIGLAEITAADESRTLETVVLGLQVYFDLLYYELHV